MKKRQDALPTPPAVSDEERERNARVLGATLKGLDVDRLRREMEERLESERSRTTLEVVRNYEFYDGKVNNYLRQQNMAADYNSKCAPIPNDILQAAHDQLAKRRIKKDSYTQNVKEQCDKLLAIHQGTWRDASKFTLQTILKPNSDSTWKDGHKIMVQTFGPDANLWFRKPETGETILINDPKRPGKKMKFFAMHDEEIIIIRGTDPDAANAIDRVPNKRDFHTIYVDVSLALKDLDTIKAIQAASLTAPTVTATQANPFTSGQLLYANYHWPDAYGKSICLIEVDVNDPQAAQHVLNRHKRHPDTSHFYVCVPARMSEERQARYVEQLTTLVREVCGADNTQPPHLCVIGPPSSNLAKAQVATLRELGAEYMDCEELHRKAKRNRRGYGHPLEVIQHGLMYPDNGDINLHAATILRVGSERSK